MFSRLYLKDSVTTKSCIEPPRTEYGCIIMTPTCGKRGWEVVATSASNSAPSVCTRHKDIFKTQRLASSLKISKD